MRRMEGRGLAIASVPLGRTRVLTKMVTGHVMEKRPVCDMKFL